MDNGFVGLSYGRLERTNGLPGHAHGEEEHDEEGEEGEEEHEEHEEENTFSEMEQDRIQLLSEFSLSDGFLTGINTRIGYTDYQHEEIHEEGEEEHEGEEHEEDLPHLQKPQSFPFPYLKKCTQVTFCGNWVRG